jgi:hypothetical protein
MKGYMPMRISNVLVAALTFTAILWTTPAPALADQIHWDYNWVPSQPAVLAGTGGISLTNVPAGKASGSSDVTVTNITTFSAASPSAPDHVVNGAYSFNLFLTDAASGATGNLRFTGVFGGTLSASSAHITNSFTGPTVQSVTLAGNLYTVRFGPYSPPGPPNSGDAGSIAAHVDVQAAGTSGPPVNTSPEPATSMLACLGLSFVGVLSWMRRCRR